MMNKTIVFVVSTLCEVGGGEKLLLEGVKYYRSIGYRVWIITWSFNENALFNNKYENKDIIVLSSEKIERTKVLNRAIDRLKSLFELRKIVKDLNPKLVICQGEYDVATVYLATKFTNIPYSFLIFGQNFQFPHDLGKYAVIFKKHLHTIINSQQGYRETIPLKIPRVSIFNRLANEIIAIIRYWAVRNAKSLFVFSKSVQWETQLLFGRTPVIVKGAFSKNIFEEKYDVLGSRLALNLPTDKTLLLSFSRLVPKKRVELGIYALQKLGNEFHLAIAGGGSDENRLKQLVKNLGLDERVTFLGFIEEQDANKLKACCDVFISMDIGDFDISPFEAMALGVKAIMPTEMDTDTNLDSFRNFNIINANADELKMKVEQIVDLPVASNYKNAMMKYSWEEYFQKILVSSFA